MTDVLIRGLSKEAVAHLDAQAARANLSRNEYLVRTLEAGVHHDDPPTITEQDWVDTAAVFADLADPEVMKGAWE
ncbi:type II toxin-antitoxin system VapB family antitoxin [Microlunatus parietis]|uniref:Antitoxin n=1 Tax=Microlunatus parietis TaxID=682979 RepID=A0A7Y9IAC7_9ACTN|nr:hypothetical protein [Microlunatus parietis]NYE73072.1 hypothetical protein [Microlunatus parietis]